MRCYDAMKAACVAAMLLVGLMPACTSDNPGDKEKEAAADGGMVPASGIEDGGEPAPEGELHGDVLPIVVTPRPGLVPCGGFCDAAICVGYDPEMLNPGHCPEAVCNDGEDNDADGFIDGCDNDCPGECPPPDLCGNDVLNVDEACDGGANCNPDCSCPNGQIPDGNLGCMEPEPEDCNDGEDNDGDGEVDCEDPECALAPECAAANLEFCQNGFDDDDDDLVDASDPDCADEIVARITIYFGQGGVLKLEAGDGEDFEGNVPADYSITLGILGNESYLKAWFFTSEFVVTADPWHSFVIWTNGTGVAPTLPPGAPCIDLFPADGQCDATWPSVAGIPVPAGGHVSGTPNPATWTNVFMQGHMAPVAP
ncbi:MAG: hypothetical protein HY611_06655 [Elusimicrobia bacterium]|nr:hypothetical protein [Elusimicrobiota bacterium]